MARCLLRSLNQVVSKANCLFAASGTQRFVSMLTNASTQNLRSAQIPFYRFDICRLAEQTVKEDPVISKDLAYVDPTLTSQSFERFDPLTTASFNCPSFNISKIIDDGSPKQTPLQLLNIIVIRKKKMRRHQLKKFKRKNLFLWRKVRMARRKVKEQKMADYEKGMAKWAKEYNPEAEIEAELKRARDAGWFIDIVANSKENQQMS